MSTDPLALGRHLNNGQIIELRVKLQLQSIGKRGGCDERLFSVLINLFQIHYLQLYIVIDFNSMVISRENLKIHFVQYNKVTMLKIIKKKSQISYFTSQNLKKKSTCKTFFQVALRVTKLQILSSTSIRNAFITVSYLLYVNKVCSSAKQFLY